MLFPSYVISCARVVFVALVGAVNGFEEVTLTAGGETMFEGNSAQYGGERGV